MPYKFEAGTPNIAGTIGLGAAVDYINEIGLDRIQAYEHELLAYGTEQLERIPGLRLIGTAREKASVLSFVLEGVHPHDVGTILDREGVAVRTGHHCAQPVLEWFGVPATTRASLAILQHAARNRRAGGRHRARCRRSSADGLDDLYQEVILDHSKRAAQFPPDGGCAQRALEGYNPLCGDKMAVYREDGRRQDRGYQLRGRGLRDLHGLGIADDRDRQRQDAPGSRQMIERFHDLLTTESRLPTNLGKLAVFSGVSRVSGARQVRHAGLAHVEIRVDEAAEVVSTE